MKVMPCDGGVSRKKKMVLFDKFMTDAPVNITINPQPNSRYIPAASTFRNQGDYAHLRDGSIFYLHNEFIPRVSVNANDSFRKPDFKTPTIFKDVDYVHFNVEFTSDIEVKHDIMAVISCINEKGLVSSSRGCRGLSKDFTKDSGIFQRSIKIAIPVKPRVDIQLTHITIDLISNTSHLSDMSSLGFKWAVMFESIKFIGFFEIEKKERLVYLSDTSFSFKNIQPKRKRDLMEFMSNKIQ